LCVLDIPESRDGDRCADECSWLSGKMAVKRRLTVSVIFSTADSGTILNEANADVTDSEASPGCSRLWVMLADAHREETYL